MFYISWRLIVFMDRSRDEVFIAEYSYTFEDIGAVPLKDGDL